MTLSDLQAWRKRVPFFILAACLLPMFLVKSKNLADADLAVKVVGPALALIGTFFYVSLDMRKPRWKRELDAHVGRRFGQA